MDELRDYRFYAEDMIHPGDTAVIYIWDSFCDTYVKKSTQKLILLSSGEFYLYVPCFPLPAGKFEHTGMLFLLTGGNDLHISMFFLPAGGNALHI
ncbi:MAG: GSCFA domain-containing protein [Bacteroidales bacterium]|nr:GSCFA domain-containing protein [Bacteroidales bacterium]